MNRTDRLLAIILELQAKRRQRAEDLAITFETSKRTIYRDIQALAEAGVPLVAIPGQGYSLVEGYFLPPLSFNTEEATMLLLGSGFVAGHLDMQYRAAALSAGRKIEAVLPEDLRNEVHYLQQSIVFVAGDPLADPMQQQMLVQLRRAIIEHRTVQLRYRSRMGDSAGQTTYREIDPYRLLFMTGAWYIVSYCHLRKDVRNFRLSRIESLSLTSKVFQRRVELDVDPPSGLGDRKLIIRVLLTHDVVSWAHETHFYYVVQEEPVPDGVRVTLAVRVVEDAIPWLLGWGTNVWVLEPLWVRERLAIEAEALFRHHSTSHHT